MILNCMLAMQYGGTEKVFLDQLKMLPISGIDVVGISRPSGEATTRAHNEGLPCEELTVWSEWDPLTQARARKIVEKYDPELILCHGLKAHRIFAGAVGEQFPIVAMTHKPGFHKNLPCELFITVAEHRRQFLLERGVPSEKVVVIPNGVPMPSWFKTDYAIPSGGAVKINAVGRLHEKKGFIFLINAISYLIKRNFDVTCSIYGEGPERNALEKQIAETGLKNCVKLPGWSNDLSTIFSNTDIFAFPSLQEDFPLAVLEAMSYAVPIVSTAIDGPKDFLRDGETALLTQARDAKAFSDILERLIRDEELRRKIATNARSEVKRSYSFEVISQRLANTLNSVVANWKRS